MHYMTGLYNTPPHAPPLIDWNQRFTVVISKLWYYQRFTIYDLAKIKDIASLPPVCSGQLDNCDWATSKISNLRLGRNQRYWIIVIEQYYIITGWCNQQIIFNMYTECTLLRYIIIHYSFWYSVGIFCTRDTCVHT